MASAEESVPRQNSHIPTTTTTLTSAPQLGPSIQTSSPQTSTGPTLTVTPASPVAPTTQRVEDTPQVDPQQGTSAAQSSSNPVSTDEMKEKNPTDSETALMSDAEKEQASSGEGVNTSAAAPSDSKTGPTTDLTRRLSGKAKETGVESKGGEGAKTNGTATSSTPITTPAPAPIASTSQPSASTSKPSTSTPAAASRTPAQTTTAHTTPPKKKRKRGGFAGLLLALGCLSAADFEDEEPARREVNQRPAAVQEKTSIPPTTAAATGTGTSVPGQGGATTSPSGTITLIGSSDNEKTPTKVRTGDTDVIVAPSTPVTMPDEETAGVTSSAVQAPGSGSELLAITPRRASQHREPSDASDAQNGTSSADADRTGTSGGYTDISESDREESSRRTGDQEAEYPLEEEYEDEEDRLIAQGGMGIPLDEHGLPAPLLPAMIKAHLGRKCLVLDLDETLLHSSFKMIPNADYIVPVEIESQTHNVYVIKRPGVDNFLKEMGRIYEIVVFTASLSKYADPVLDMLDTEQVVLHRLFRESCYNHKGNYVKDLSQLGRDIHETIIIDNSPASYIFHPNNAVPVSTWFNDPHDTELTDLCPFLSDLSTVPDVRGVLDGSI